MRFAVLLSLCTWVLAGSANADGLVQAIEVRCVEEAMYLSVTGKMISADYFWKDDASTRKLLANNGVYTLDRLSEEPVLCKIGSHLVKVTISINERQGATKCIDEIAGDLLVDVTDDRMAKVKLPSNCLDAGSRSFPALDQSERI